MGWAHGTNPDGREVGYGVRATCDQEGCNEPIDRGLSYVCGSMHGSTDRACGGYFCSAHRRDIGVELRDGEAVDGLCPACFAEFERNYPDWIEWEDEGSLGLPIEPEPAGVQP